MTLQTPTPSTELNYLTVTEVARRLNKSEDAVRRLCRNGKLVGARRENEGSPWQIPESAIEEYWRNNPPSNLWARIRTTHVWRRAVATIGVIGFVLYLFNNFTGFFSNIFGASPLLGFACRMPIIQASFVCSASFPVKPAAKDETLILIATFNGAHAAEDLPHLQIKRKIDEEIRNLNVQNVRAEVHPMVLTGGEEARVEAEKLGKVFNASIVIWGEDGGTKVLVNFFNLRQQDSNSALAEIEENVSVKANITNPNAYIQFINNELPTQMGFLSLFAIGQSYSISKEYERSAQVIEEAIHSLNGITTTIGLANAHFFLSWLYGSQLKKIDLAIEQSTIAITLDPQFPFVYNNRGSLYYSQGNFLAAIQDFDQAISLYPTYSTAYYNRGLLHYSQRDMVVAIQDYDHAIALDSKYAAAYNNRGLAYFAQGNWSAAILDYDRTIEIAPDAAITYVNRGLARRANRDWTGAIADFDHAIKLDPMIPLAYINRGLTRQANEDWTGAIADFDYAIKLDPTFAPAYYHRGNTRLEKGDLKGAIKDFDQAIKQDPQSLDVYMNRGLVRRAIGDRNGAITDFDRVLEIEPKLAYAYWLRGLTYQELGELQVAFNDFKHYLELDPNAANRSKVEQSIIEIEADLAKEK